MIREQDLNLWWSNFDSNTGVLNRRSKNMHITEFFSMDLAISNFFTVPFWSLNFFCKAIKKVRYSQKTYTVVTLSCKSQIYLPGPLNIEHRQISACYFPPPKTTNGCSSACVHRLGHLLYLFEFSTSLFCPLYTVQSGDKINGFS